MFDSLRQTLERNKKKYLAGLFDLVALDTRTLGHGIDGGREKAGQDYIAGLMRQIGASVSIEPLREELIQQGISRFVEGNPGHNFCERYNVRGLFRGGGDGRKMLFNGHVDTMPPGNRADWSFEPLRPFSRAGRAYGLGICDMKSGLMAAIMAVRLLADSNIQWPGEVEIVSVADEEGGGNGSLCAVVNGVKADAAVVCEPSDGNIFVAHMGFLFFDITVGGIALHAGKKWLGINAIEKMLLLITALQELERQWLMRYKHPLLPPPTINIGVIDGGSAGSTVPDRCKLKICVHYLPEQMNRQQVIDDINGCLELRAQGDSWLRHNPPQVSIYQSGGAFNMQADHRLVSDAVAALRHCTDRQVEVAATAAGNDARLFRHCAGLPTIIMGPGQLQNCHIVDEYIELSDYYQMIEAYARLILSFNGG